VDGEFPTVGGAIGPITLGVDAFVATVLAIAIPGDYEVALLVHCRRWILLEIRCVRVDPKFTTLRDPSGVEALGVNAGVAAVLGAVPDDDEVTGRVHRDGRELLSAGGVGVDPELAALGNPGGIIAPGVDADVTTVLVEAVPGDDEIAGLVHRYRREF